MPIIELQNVDKFFQSGGQKIKAVDDVSFEVHRGEIFTLLGPSGCGKTTTLRCIAGLEPIDGGQILFSDTVVSEPNKTVPPEHREIGFMYQSYALWPHMTVSENISFALKGRKYPKENRKERIEDLLELAALEGMGNRYPSELSGGQRQRVAFMRAISYEPEVLLMDEPLSNLDLNQRQRMRKELLKVLKERQITTVYVTHDQEEAFEISDTIIVMNEGRVVQQGTPEEIYNDPQSTFVANFVGDVNIFDVDFLHSNDGEAFCEVKGATPAFSIRCSHNGNAIDGNLSVAVRPENITLRGISDTGSAPDTANTIDLGDGLQESEVNTYEGTVIESYYRGLFTLTMVDLNGLIIKVNTQDREFADGDDILIDILPEHADLIAEV
ncbi:ABC transporter ATP-binding protein [Haladaptatus sp. DJG-WS-42]|uniref:ABC transporter ATP-binding protein n=1 Tax=Haladaptatus sp. DJG-WS-42 TaxID=3120516 RepID=UPI0030D1521C